MSQRLLIVEDEEDLRYALLVRLKNAGFDCEIATNGREGLDKARQLQPDLIIADLLMPELDGYELCQQLESDERTSSIPVIVLTVVAEQLPSRRTRDSEKRMKLKGVARVMRKPFDSDALVEVIRELLAKRSTRGGDNGSEDHSGR